MTEREAPITESGIKFWFKAENNKPEIEKAKIIADILEVNLNELAIQDIFPTNNGSNTPFTWNDCNGKNTSHRLQTKTMRKFLDLYADYGTDELLIPLIDKLEQIAKIVKD